MTTPTDTVFAVTIMFSTDQVPDLVALGKKLRDAEDGDGGRVTTVEDALAEVACLFAAAGTSDFGTRSGLTAAIVDVAAVLVPA